MKALLIDPYQRKIHQLDIESDLQAWYKVLRCDCVDRAEVCRNPQNTLALDIWVDDEGFQREPIPPTFKLRGYPNALAGYGLMLCANLANGKSTPCNFSAEQIKAAIAWENWEERLDPEDYLEELTRVPSWELV
jgi:hypothetical protein